MTDIAQKKTPRKYRRPLAKGASARLDAASEPPRKGSILAAMRRSPLVGADLNLVRDSGSNRHCPGDDD
jgi:hypothetical protein